MFKKFLDFWNYRVLKKRRPLQVKGDLNALFAPGIRKEYILSYKGDYAVEIKALDKYFDNQNEPPTD
jgi:hypothetical protein